MPPRLPIANVCKFESIYNFSSSSQMAVIQHYSYTSTPPHNPSQSDINSSASLWFAALSSDLMPFVNGDITLVETKITPLDSNTTNVGTHVGTSQGGVSGATVPASAAVLVNYTIDARWRGGRPRNFWPAMGGGNLLDPSHWHSTDLATYIGGLANVDNAIRTFGQTDITFNAEGCVSYFYTGPNPTPPPATVPGLVRTPPVFFPFTNTVASTLVGSQRRRIRSTSP